MFNLTLKRNTILAIFLFLSSIGFASQQVSEVAAQPDSSGKKKKEKDPSDSIKKVKLFKDDEPLQMSITADIRAMIGEKKDTVFQKALVRLRLPDSTDAEDEIEIRARGNFRREFCYFPSVMLNFKKKGEKTKLSSLGKIKMVCTCKTGGDFEQLVLKEYLTYKIFNLLTDVSFRVRLTKVNFIDVTNKRKPFQYYGFLIEDVDDVAKRNDCKEYEIKNLNSELTDRKYMTMVNIFQYMIGNLDWSVPGAHNIKFVISRDSGIHRPYAIPYDFDYAGLVDAPYAVPPESIGTTSVTERVYRGYARSPQELNEVVAIFKAKKDSIYALVNNFQPLDKRQKTKMISYLNEFYETINSDRGIRMAFIDNARTN
ncbi:hypothetical protein [Pollutibacter soli]|uniref:hypothetical protein n=1 Tax=Pollutibacter soli TaxID=3034157 RepID=UPI003013B765